MALLRKFLLIAAGLIHITALAASRPPALDFVEIAIGLTTATQVTGVRDGSGRLFITEKPGTIRIFKDGVLLPAPFLDISSQVAQTNERGLLSMAFHPRFTENRRFYVLYSVMPDVDPGGPLRIASFLVDPADPDRALPESETEVLGIPHPHNSHWGGNLHFGRDGRLYLATGDGGSGADSENNAQNDASLLGKWLRIDLDAVPVSAGVQVLAKGFRNPWRWSFDRLTNDAYIGDVGQNAVEEVNFVPAGVTGLNFGWRVLEGDTCFNPPTGCDPAGFVAPIFQYPHTTASFFKSVTGGFVYRGTKYAALRGYYVFADFIDNRVWASRREGGAWVTTLVTPEVMPYNNISSFGEDESGELYAAAFGNGRLYRIVPRSLPYRRPRADLDGDTRADILWQHTDGRVASWIMHGATQAGGRILFGAGTGWSVAATGDLNGDGRTDIVWKHTDGSVAMWLMDGSTQVGGARLRAAGSGWSAALVRDFDGDGRDDILWFNANGAAEIDGAAVMGIGSLWTPRLVADFDGDGRADIVWQHADGTVLLTLMNGATITAGRLLIPGGTGWTPVLAADAKPGVLADIVWTHTDGRAAIWTMDGTTQVGGRVLFAAGTGWTPILRADIDGDGRVDLLWQHTDGGAAYWLLDGDRQVGGARIFPGGSSKRIVRADDFEGDARADLLVIDTANGAVEMLTGEGVAFAPAPLVGPTTGWAPLP